MSVYVMFSACMPANIWFHPVRSKRI